MVSRADSTSMKINKVEPMMIWKNSLNKRIKKLKEMDITKKMALQHIRTLFSHAKEVIYEDPQLAQRYSEVARRISMRTRVRPPRENKLMICKHCKGFILPGVNCRVRIQTRREPHVVITCLKCMSHMRIPLKQKRKPL